MKRFLPATFFLFFFVISFFLYLSKDSKKAQADTASHIVISEIQTGKTAAPTDEFVELYNPTNSDVNLAGWRVTKKNSSGNESTLVASISGTIKSYGFFLIAHSAAYTGSVSADIFYSAPSLNIANTNNSAVLYSDSGVTQVDLVGFGSAPINETVSASNPPVDGSIERKANGLLNEELLGNGEDTDNNANDFLTRSTPDPQNSNSAIEPVATPTPTPTSTPTLTPTPSNTPTPTPTATPTPTPTSSPSSVSDTSSSSDSSPASSVSCNDSKPGSGPKLLSAEIGINSVFLHWSQAADPVSYYLVAYGLSSGVYQYGNPNVGGKGTISYAVSGLSAGKTYYFKVRAGNGCTPGDFSNELFASPLGKEINSDLADNFTQGVLGVIEEKAVTKVSKDIKNGKVSQVAASAQAKIIEKSFFEKALVFIFSPFTSVWGLISRLKFF